MDPAPDPTATTRLLRAVGAGDAEAAEQLFPVVYDELRRLAGRLRIDLVALRGPHLLRISAFKANLLSAPGGLIPGVGVF